MTYKTVGFLAICLLVALTSCEQKVAKNSTAITFAHTGETRATASSTATIWGYNSTNWVYASAFKDANGAFSEALAQKGFTADLTGNQITITSPTLPTEPEYWQADNYHFYSLWPPKSAATVYRATDAAQGYVAGIHFFIDAQASQTDQLFAFARFTSSEAAGKATPVDFVYNHILSKLIFKIRKNTGNAENVVMLNYLSLSGVHYKGTFNFGNETDFDSYLLHDQETTTVVLYSNNESIVEGEYIYNEASDNFVEKTDANKIIERGYKKLTSQEGGTQVSEGYLVVPQELPYNEIKFTLTYTFIGEEIVKETITKDDGTTEEVDKVVKITAANPITVTGWLPISTIGRWVANKEYTYNMYLAAESNDIWFGTPTISSWNTKQTGATIIVQ